MSALGPAEIRARLRHRAPALALERELVVGDGARRRRFETIDREVWHAAEVLDAAAQAAGLCARSDAASANLSLLVVAYEGVRWPTSIRGRRFTVEVRPIRAFLSMFQFAVEVRRGDADEELCLALQVTLAKEGG